jgi:hypothetical protein
MDFLAQPAHLGCIQPPSYQVPWVSCSDGLYRVLWATTCMHTQKEGGFSPSGSGINLLLYLSTVCD